MRKSTTKKQIQNLLSTSSDKLTAEEMEFIRSRNMLIETGVPLILCKGRHTTEEQAIIRTIADKLDKDVIELTHG